jgi:ribosomal protein L34E
MRGEVTSSSKTRLARRAKGKCGICLKRRATPGHATCATCRKHLREYSADRYDDLRRQKLCARCKEPTGGPYLCPKHVAERKRKRSS